MFIAYNTWQCHDGTFDMFIEKLPLSVSVLGGWVNCLQILWLQQAGE